MIIEPKIIGSMKWKEINFFIEIRDKSTSVMIKERFELVVKYLIRRGHV